MTVRELIELLEIMPKDAEIFLNNDNPCYAENFELDEDGDVVLW